MLDFFRSRFLLGSTAAVIVWATVLIAIIALVDWHFEEDISFGFLYLFPMLMMGGVLGRWQISAVAVLCTVLTEAFDPFPWTNQVGIPRLILTFAAFFGMGLYRFGAERSSRLATRHLGQIEREVELRRLTEEQLEFLISTSPATIFTLDAGGKVLLANDAAHRLLRVAAGSLEGRSVSNFFPPLAGVPPSTPEAHAFRTEMECHAHRADGEMFLAHIWFSTYRTMAGPRLAAVVFDASDELRDRTELNLQQVLSGSKVAVGALCHEIRNLCGAIGVVHSKLARNCDLQVSEDFRALSRLVRGLEDMAGLELRQTKQAAAESIDVHSVLDELRIVIDTSFQEAGMAIRWEVPAALPRVWADRQALLQACLNIAKNSHRAMEEQIRQEMLVRAEAQANHLAIRFIDSGPGVARPDLLFAPFQPGAKASGLGLYLSRTLVRAFHGEIEYEPRAQGSCFAILLALAADHEPALVELG